MNLYVDSLGMQFRRREEGTRRSDGGEIKRCLQDLTARFFLDIVADLYVKSTESKRDLFVFFDGFKYFRGLDISYYMQEICG